MSASTRAAFQGTFGAFSHEACVALLPEAEPTPYPSFEAAFEAVCTGACAFGVIPSANTIAGPVPEVAPLLAASGLAVLAEHSWPIRMQLMGVSGGSLAEVRTVVVQVGAFWLTNIWPGSSGKTSGSSARSGVETSQRVGR